MNRLIIVGELNPYGSGPSWALHHLPRGASGDRLRQHRGERRHEAAPFAFYGPFSCQG